MIRAEDGNGNVSSAVKENIYLSLVGVKSYRARAFELDQIVDEADRTRLSDGLDKEQT
jgi:hypothetical protein